MWASCLLRKLLKKLNLCWSKLWKHKAYKFKLIECLKCYWKPQQYHYYKIKIINCDLNVQISPIINNCRYIRITVAISALEMVWKILLNLTTVRLLVFTNANLNKSNSPDEQTTIHMYNVLVPGQKIVISFKNFDDKLNVRKNVSSVMLTVLCILDCFEFENYAYETLTLPRWVLCSCKSMWLTVKTKGNISCTLDFYWVYSQHCH